MNGADKSTEEEKNFELPDGKLLPIDRKLRFTAGEILFNPIVAGLERVDIVTNIFDSISRCDEDLQRMLVRNIIMTGGSSEMIGFSERLQKELYMKCPKSIRASDISVFGEVNKKYGAWIGGSVIGSISTFRELFITRAEYDENQDKHLELICKRTF